MSFVIICLNFHFINAGDITDIMLLRQPSNCTDSFICDCFFVGK